MGKKRGQISFFIVLGIVLVIGSLLFFLISTRTVRQPSETTVADETASSLQKEIVDEYIEGCIDKTIVPAIKLMSEQGGTLNLVDYGLYNHIKYKYMLKSQHANDNTNCGIVVSRYSMEQEINQYLNDKLLGCVDFQNFQNEGFEVEFGQHQTASEIAVDMVAIELTFPITISKGDFVIDFTEFKENIMLPLGRLFDTSLLVMKNETTRFYFDKDEWMTATGENTQIYRYKPYPDTFYSIRKRADNYAMDLIFNFGIHGQDVIENPGDTYIAEWNKCYSGEPVTRYSDELCDGKPCEDCFNGRKHGERWCEYDAVAGGGKDPVGSRHYQSSCINGHIYTDECTDYRLEMCAQERNDKYSARCRPNRWQDCVLQYSEDGCSDTDVRDCYWADYLLVELNPDNESRRNSRRPVDINWSGRPANPAIPFDPAVTIDRSRCVPEVPPGLKFWDKIYGVDVTTPTEDYCYNSNQLTFFYQPTFARMGVINVPRYWLDATAANCFMTSDCGNYNNYLGEYSKGSFFSTHGQLHDQMESLNYSGYENNPTTVFTTTDVNEYALKQTYTPLDPQTIQEATDYYQQIAASWSPCDAFSCKCYDGAWLASVPCDGSCGVLGERCPETPLPSNYKKWALGVGICSPWTPPSSGLCSACEAGGSCSEYKCNSISQICRYSEDEFGVSHCSSTVTGADQPEIIFGQRFVEDPYVVNDHMIPFPPEAMGADAVIRTGYKIRPGYPPKTKFTLTFNTTIPSKCKLTSIPTSEFRANNDALAAIAIDFYPSIEHSYEIDVVADMSFTLEYLEAFLGLSSPLGIGEIFSEPMSTIARWLITYLKTNHELYLFADCYDLTETNAARKFFNFGIDFTDNKKPEVKLNSPDDETTFTRGTNIVFDYGIVDDSWLEPPRNICYLYNGQRVYEYINDIERFVTGWSVRNFTDVDNGTGFLVNWTVHSGKLNYSIIQNVTAFVHDDTEILNTFNGLPGIYVKWKIADWYVPDWNKRKYMIVHLNGTYTFSTSEYLYNTVLEPGDYEWNIKCSDGLNNSFYIDNRTFYIMN